MNRRDVWRTLKTGSDDGGLVQDRFWGFVLFERLLAKGDFLSCKNHTQPQDDFNMTLVQ